MREKKVNGKAVLIQKDDSKKHQLKLIYNNNLINNEINTKFELTNSIFTKEIIPCEGCGELTKKGLLVKHHNSLFCKDCVVEIAIAKKGRGANE